MEKYSPPFQIAGALLWEDLGNGLKRQVFGYDQNLMLVKVQFETGAIGAMHAHPHVQSSYVASGTFELTIGDEKKILQAGDGYFVAPNIIHGAVCLSAGMLIDAFHPCREDFLS